ncbi:hypothetical protein R3P38DRAFT_3223887 [Favolaschia claudopus]|uniref:Uncharacterized protein n=1 Tax=Favolaschia claudopus TaxID=2862362 RepID=A0AAV9ZXK7_9AGAR
MYIKHQANFLTNPLYADSQLIVRCIMINANFQRNPDLDRGHRKLKLSGALGIDHINPASWLGDVVVGNVDIAKEYKQGKQDANDVLRKHFGADYVVKWDELFVDSDWDHLRPVGIYIGTSFSPGDDRSEMETERVPIPPLVNPDGPSVSTDEINQALLNTAGESESDDSGVDLGLDLDNYFSDIVDDPHTEDQPEMLKPQQENNLENTAKEEDTVKINDLAGFLVRTKEDVCLCTLLIKEFKKDNQSTPLSAIDVEEQENPNSGITVVDQLMEITQEREETKWQWNKKFLKLVEATAQAKNKQLLLELPSSQIYPLAPEISDPDSSTWAIDFAQLAETTEFTWTTVF